MSVLRQQSRPPLLIRRTGEAARVPVRSGCLWRSHEQNEGTRQAPTCSVRRSVSQLHYEWEKWGIGSTATALAGALRYRTAEDVMIRKLKSGQYRLYSRQTDSSGKRRNLGTFRSRTAAE